VKLTSITGPGGLLANGADVALIDVEVTDSNGERCPTYQNRCDFTCSGEGIWRGGYNSGKAKSINNTYLDLECGINRVSVRSTLKAGKIRVTATVKGLSPATIEIDSKPVSIRDGMSAELPALPKQETLKPPAPHDPRLELAPPGKIVATEGRLITGFSYSGPKGGASVKSLFDDGNALYTDQDFLAKDLPSTFKNKGAEYIQVPCADASYSALDLIQFSAAADIDIYIAHDDAVPAPKWLTTDFTKTDRRITLGDAKLTLFTCRVNKDASLTLGSNAPDDAPGSKGLMYIVIAIPHGK
jgi:beta-galactosidase